MHGFEQLYSGVYNPPIGWDRGAMWVGVGNNLNEIATAIKRITYWQEYTRIRVEAWLTLAQWYGDNNVRAVALGCDQADNAGNRSYFALRHVFTKTTGFTAPTNRWDLKTGTDSAPSFTVLPGQTSEGLVIDASTAEPDITSTEWPAWTTNENKRGVMYMALDFSPTRGVYLGARFQNLTIGTCRDSGDEDSRISALSGQTSTLARFSNGLNVTFDLYGQGGGVTATSADLYVHRCRLQGWSE